MTPTADGPDDATPITRITGRIELRDVFISGLRTG